MFLCTNPRNINFKGADFNQNKTQNSNQQQGPQQNPNSAQGTQQPTGNNNQSSSTSQNQNQPGASQQNTSWAQAAGKGLSSSTQNQTVAQTSANKQLEQLNNMREALFSMDGWGGVSIINYKWYLLALRNIYSY